MSTQWKSLAPAGLEITHSNAPSARIFGLLLVVAGLAMLVAVVGGLLRREGGPGLGWNVLGMFAFALGFVAVGAWAVGWQGVRRLDAGANTYHEGGSLFGIRWGQTRPLSDFSRVIVVRKPPVARGSTRDTYDLFLFANPTDWTMLTSTYDNAEAHDIGAAAGKLLHRPVEKLTEAQWDKLAP